MPATKKRDFHVVHVGRKEMQYEATDTDESDLNHRQPVGALPPEAHDTPTLEQTQNPHDVATCDPKYWACPGANGLKASARPVMPICHFLQANFKQPPAAIDCRH